MELWINSSVNFSSVHSVVSNSLQPHGLQHARPPCPLPTPRVYSDSCPLSRWCHSTISSFVVPFSSCLQSFLASGSFQRSQFFTSGGQSIGVSASASVVPIVFAMTGAFSWQNSVNLCLASFCTSRPNLPVTPSISWLPTFAFQSPIMKRTCFGGC